MATPKGRGGRETGPPFDDPRHRRWWLLTEALEGAPLEEALEIARAAEVFLAVGDGAAEEFAPTGGEHQYLH